MALDDKQRLVIIMSGGQIFAKPLEGFIGEVNFTRLASLPNDVCLAQFPVDLVVIKG